MDYKIILYIIFGVLPSVTWLAYYLSKDLHPEPKKTILRMFLWGVLVTIPVFFTQMGLTILLNECNFSPLTTSLLYWFLVIAFTEEFFRYLVVRFKVQNTQDVDEPLDIMLYMVIVALGFAALENVLYIFNPATGLSFQELIQRTMFVSLVRFVGATFLHTLCSGVIGYFMAMGFYHSKKAFYYIFLGVTFAVLLHGAYDLSIMNAESYDALIVPGIILVTLGFLTFLGFEQLKRMKSVSIIK